MGQLRIWAWGLCSGLALSAPSAPSLAFTVSITPGSKEIYLQVGAGGFVGNFQTGGTPGNNPAINTVSVTVPLGSVGNGAPQPMTTDSAVANSPYDGRAFCTPPQQLYIGAFYQRPGNSNAHTAVITATAPASLVSAAGDQIPFSAISWTSSGIGDSGSEVFPAGTFIAGGSLVVGSFTDNTWGESCWTFSYNNAAVARGGTYTGQVVYTMTAP